MGVRAGPHDYLPIHVLFNTMLLTFVPRDYDRPDSGSPLCARHDSGHCGFRNRKGSAWVFVSWCCTCFRGSDNSTSHKESSSGSEETTMEDKVWLAMRLFRVIKRMSPLRE